MSDDIIPVERIMEMIPHRYPFLLVDKLINTVPFERTTGIKNVTFNEPQFMGHFPGRPVMPGVLILEAMAQTAGALVVHSLGKDSEGKLVYFTSVESAKFRRPVGPGDTLHLHVEILQSKRNIWKVACIAEVDGNKVTEATISAMIMDEKLV